LAAGMLQNHGAVNIAEVAKWQEYRFASSSNSLAMSSEKLLIAPFFSSDKFFGYKNNHYLPFPQFINNS
jgi:hypothetical protein